jgi:rhodanese-related sulfurtransferase
MSPLTRQLFSILGSVAVCVGIIGFALRDAQDTSKNTQDLGVVTLNGIRDFEVTIQNPSDKERRIIRVQPTCPCLSVLSTPKTLAPREIATLQVRFTPEALGVKRVDLATNLEGTGSILSHVRVEVVPPVEAFPSSEQIRLARERRCDGTVIGAAVAVTKSHSERLVLDVRSSNDYQHVSVPGSMNVPLVELASLPSSLHSQPALVIDNGIVAAETVEMIKRLRESGWKDLQLLEGGIAAWQANGGLVGGTASAASRLVKVEAARQFCTLPGWSVAVPAQLATAWSLHEIWPDLLTFNAREKPTTIALDLAQQLKSRRLADGAVTTALHVLIATQSGENASLIAQELQSRCAGSPIFLLEGGVRAYLEHLRSLQPPKGRRWTSMADYAGVLADVRSRQRLLNSCSSCPR